MKKNNSKNQYEETMPKEVEVFFSIAKESIPHASKESLRALLAKIPSVTETEFSRYKSRDGARGTVSPFTNLFNKTPFGKAVRSPWMISSVGVATMFIVFVTSGVATTNKDLTRLADSSYSLRSDINFSRSESLGTNDIIFITNELIAYANNVPEEDTTSMDIVASANTELTELSKISYEI